MHASEAAAPLAEWVSACGGCATDGCCHPTRHTPARSPHTKRTQASSTLSVATPSHHSAYTRRLLKVDLHTRTRGAAPLTPPPDALLARRGAASRLLGQRVATAHAGGHRRPHGMLRVCSCCYRHSSLLHSKDAHPTRQSILQRTPHISGWLTASSSKRNTSLEGSLSSSLLHTVLHLLQSSCGTCVAHSRCSTLMLCSSPRRQKSSRGGRSTCR